MRKLTATTIAVLLFYSYALAQKKPEIKIEKVTAEDLQKKVYAIDSNATAVVLADIGKTKFIGNTDGWFSIVHTHFKRVHILNKTGYSLADVEIPLYTEGDGEEKVNSIKAVTYNLENGKLVETKLDKAAVFTNKLDKNHIEKKFTLPNVKEGSIIEFEYQVTSDFLFNLQPWNFQDKVPTLWSEYQLALPNFFGYIFLNKGYLPFFINEHKERSATYNIVSSEGTSSTRTYTVNSGVIDYRWVIKDVPALKEENFTSTLRNHLSRIEFQLSEYRQPLVAKQIMRTWPQVTKEMLEREDFGSNLNTFNNWLSDVVDEATKGATTSVEKAKGIFAYVRDHITCTDHNALLLQQSIKDVLKSKKGTVSEVNMLLTAMLKYAKLTADPVMLSTRSHGFTYPFYPIMNQYNYVVCRTVIDGKEYFLDASHSRLGFGKLPVYCYNSTARIINEQAHAVELRSDSLKEVDIASVFILNNEKGGLTGRFRKTYGTAESLQMREQLQEKGKEEYIKGIKKSFSFDLEVANARFDSLEKFDYPLTVDYEFSTGTNDEDIIYFNPMMGEGEAENPFKSAERLYPVEMPFTMDKTFVLNMEVPKGYTVDELPKGIKVKLNEKGEGEFEYLIVQQNDRVQLRSRVKFTRATFMPDEYEMLREFYNLIVNKHNEQVVFKKKL